MLLTSFSYLVLSWAAQCHCRKDLVLIGIKKKKSKKLENGFLSKKEKMLQTFLENQSGAPKMCQNQILLHQNPPILPLRLANYNYHQSHLYIQLFAFCSSSSSSFLSQKAKNFKIQKKKRINLIFLRFFLIFFTNRIVKIFFSKRDEYGCPFVLIFYVFGTKIQIGALFIGPTNNTQN